MRHLFIAVLLTLPLAAWAQTAPLTEAEALRLGLSRNELSDLEQSSIAAAEADAQAAGIMPNPTLGYSRERMGGSSGSVEETWQLAQTFDFSGRRSLRREAAERRVDAVVAGNALRRTETAADIRRRFHEVIYRQQVVQALETWINRFSRIEAIVGKQARAGEASGYDQRRLARESQMAQARMATEQAALHRSRERLAALTGSARTQQVIGKLLPLPLSPMETSLSTLEQRPDLRALSRRAEASDLESRAAARGWAPDVTLGVGSKRWDNGQVRDNGAIVTLSIPLPLFDRQQADEQRAAAEALNARAEYGLARRRAEGDLRGLHRQVEQLTAAATDYRTRAVATSPELLRIAEAAYQGGESTLLELLDAYRGALEAETTALELESKAREARIDYDLLTGSVTE